MNDYQRAIDIYEELMSHRRYFHQNAEIGLNTVMTLEYIEKQLNRLNIKNERCGCGIVAYIGQGKPCILLRADIDALALKEQTALSFACDKDKMHACGHDFHAAMLLGAAKLLKQEESLLNGSIKLMFQPGEETLSGAKNMIEHHVLNQVSVALALHVAAGNIPLGLVMYNDNNVMMSASCRFQIKVWGRSSHGAYPYKGVDAIYITTQIIQSLNAFISKEFNIQDQSMVSIGRIHGGTSYNIICDEVILEGSIRSYNDESMIKIKPRMKSMITQIAKTYKGQAIIEFSDDIPALKNDAYYTNTFINYLKELNIPNLQLQNNMQASASEDFAYIAQKVKSVYLYISAGIKNHPYNAHHPKVLFHEDALVHGCAYLTHIAKRYLQDHSSESYK